jgi:hypothetical protein
MRPEGIEPSTYLCCIPYAAPKNSRFSLCSAPNFSVSRTEQPGGIRLKGATKVQHKPGASVGERGGDLSLPSSDGAASIEHVRPSTHELTTSVGEFV